MNWKRLLAYITGAMDEELLLRNEYLVTENRVLRHQIKGRILLTDPERISLAQIAKRLVWVAETLSKGNHTQRMDAGKDAAPPVLVLCSEGQGDNSRLAIA